MRRSFLRQFAIGLALVIGFGGAPALAQKLSGDQKANRQVIKAVNGQTVSLVLPKKGFLYITPRQRFTVLKARNDGAIHVEYGGNEGIELSHFSGDGPFTANLEIRLADGRSVKFNIRTNQAAFTYNYVVVE